jgi:hypothetical protein
MSNKTLTLFFLVILPLCYCQAQIVTDSVLLQLQKIPIKYLAASEKKAKVYSSRITGKTESTLIKLSRWEQKIQTLLEKTSPETAARLFSSSQMTFTTALQKYREGINITAGYKASYDQYRDELTMQVKYLEDKKDLLDKKYLQPLARNKEKIDKLEEDIKNTEAVQQFIKERKKALINESIKYIGKSRYLQKINKESYYYTETLRNYKEIFSDKKKSEETAIALLNKIPAFKKFIRENSMLASLFRVPDNSGSAQSLAGLQTRASVNSLIQDRIASGGPNAREIIQQNMQQAQAQLSQLKDRLLKAGGSNSDTELPDFKPNMQKTKTFVQRLEYGFNFQAVKRQSLLPGGADLGLSIGYKLNDKSVLGLGTSYKLGLGSIEKIRVSHQGIGLRSFMDWKLKKQFFLSGGFEMNYNSSFKNIAELRDVNIWQQAGLLGISKKAVMKSKLMKGGKLQLLYDFLYRQHVPVSQPVVFRVGYQF